MWHVLTASQFNREEIEEIFAIALDMERILERGGSELAKGKILATLFYEPSTRTRLSFETAMHRLGGRIISETDVQFSSLIKGERLEDTARIIGGYADIIAIRSKKAGDAARVAEYAGVPVLNGGDGPAEHPTQAMLDLYTIKKHFPSLGLEPINIAFVGDLLCGRTVHSAVLLLRNFPKVHLYFIAPKALQIPDKYFNPESDQKMENLSEDLLSKMDVVYCTRIQKERLEPSLYEQYKDAFRFTPEKVQHMKDTAILMHPLPRVTEIDPAVDALPQATYFEQAQNGVPVRMALIAKALGLIT